MRGCVEGIEVTNHLREHADDPERCKYSVQVQWLHTVLEAQALLEVSMFSNQNTVCQPKTPKWHTTVDQLKARFGVS